MTATTANRPKLADLAIGDLLEQLADTRQARAAIGRMRLRCHHGDRDNKLHQAELSLIGIESDLFDALRSSFRSTAFKQLEEELNA